MTCSVVATLISMQWTVRQLASCRILKNFVLDLNVLLWKLDFKARMFVMILLEFRHVRSVPHCFSVIYCKFLFFQFWVIKITSVFLYGISHLIHFLKPGFCYCRFVTFSLNWVQGLTYLCWVGSFWCYAQRM